MPKTKARPVKPATDWSQPQEVSDVLYVFPARVMHLMPAHEDIPDEFKGYSNHWSKWQRNWFFEGLKQMPTPKDGIDLKKAMRHLHCIQYSFEPQHEHKAATVAYLASLWFASPGPTEAPDPDPAGKAPGEL